MERNRNDHYSPRGYLWGFVHPSRENHTKPLWVFDIEHSRWSERSTKRVGSECGFYDYSENSEPDATAEDAFKRHENDFPKVRDLIRKDGYATWERHREVLVSFAAMLAARSPLFRAQTVSAILPSLGKEAEGVALAKNYSITTMRAEIERRAKEWIAFDWVLGTSTRPEHPFITSDQGVGMRADFPNQNVAYEKRDFWLWFPVSWDMCLIGSSMALSPKPTTELDSQQVTELQTLTRQQARRFLVSPVPLPSVL